MREAGRVDRERREPGQTIQITEKKDSRRENDSKHKSFCTEYKSCTARLRFLQTKNTDIQIVPLQSSSVKNIIK